MKDNSLRLGGFKLTPLSDGTFWLDGGAMFGVVPKALWNKLNPADELNRIELALNTLLIQTGNANVLVDTGIGAKVDAKFTEMYRFERAETLVDSLKRCGLDVNDIDYVINTHLHFDHCGGNTVAIDGRSVPTFPRAKYIIQKLEWEDALNPNERTRASYLKENFISLEEKGQLNLVEGGLEVTPGIKVMRTPGHTAGHQSVLIESVGKKAMYLGDLMPTTSHFKIPYVMGYDLYPLEIMETKKKIIDQAINEKWLFIFEHDPKVIFAYPVEENGKRMLKEI
ncbi:MAG TPA: MBL fold metallo-hydrolase [bacterium]